MSFSNRKIIVGSTPIFADASPVLAAYGESDQRVYECPCPQCGAYHEIIWADIEWPEGEPHRAADRCPSCKALIDERRKAEMVQNGVWRATKPEVTDHAGFRLNALVSLLANASWPKLARVLIRAKSDPAELQVFSNTVLAEGWSIPSQIDQTAVSARAEPISLENIPVEVIALTCGIDVQDDRCEASIVGWTRDHVAIVLAHFVIWGSYQDQSLWDEVDELLRTKWRHKWGGLLKVDATAIDCSDGDHADHIINFAVPRTARRVSRPKAWPGRARRSR